MGNVIQELQAMNFTDLPEMEDMSVIKEGLGKGSGYELLKKYDKLIDLGLECWQYHFEFLNLVYRSGNLLPDHGPALPRHPDGYFDKDVGPVLILFS